MELTLEGIPEAYVTHLDVCEFHCLSTMPDADFEKTRDVPPVLEDMAKCQKEEPPPGVLY